MNKKNINVIFFIVSLIILSTTIPITLQSTARDRRLCAIKGTLYINDEIAPVGIQIDLVFPEETFNTTTFEWEDGFNYNIGITNHVGETGFFYVFYLGQYLIPEDNQSVFIESGVVVYYIDLHIDTINSPPNKPQDPDPANNSEDVSVNPILSVLVTDPDNDPMDVYFYNASGVDLVLIDVAEDVPNGNRAEVTWPDLEYGTTYKWCAIANDSVFENKSDTWYFTTMLPGPNHPPNKPQDPDPANNSEDVSVNPILSVLVTDPDNNPMDVYFYDASGVDLVLIDVAEDVPNGSIAEVTWPDLEYGTTYKWCAIANDSVLENRSETWNFTTMLPGPNHPPNKPQDPDPANNSEDVSVNPILSVLVTDPDNDKMDVSFYDASDGSLIDVDEDVQNGSRAEVTWSGLQYDTNYSWYAVANDSFLENTSDVWTFTIEKDPNEPPTIELIKPERKRFYFRNRRLFRFPDILIIGYIDIEVNVTDNIGVEKVEFYIDGNNLKNTSTEPKEARVYSWTWNERRLFGHTITVIAYDTDGNIATETKSLFIFNFPLLHPLRP